MKKTLQRLGIAIGLAALAATAAFASNAPPNEQVFSRMPQVSLQIGDSTRGTGENIGFQRELTPATVNVDQGIRQSLVIRQSQLEANAANPLMMNTFLPSPWASGRAPTALLEASVAPNASDQRQGIQSTGITKMDLSPPGMVLAHGGGSGGMLDPNAIVLQANGGGSSCISGSRMPAFQT